MILLKTEEIEDVLAKEDKGFNSPIDFDGVEAVAKAQLKKVVEYLKRYGDIIPNPLEAEGKQNLFVIDAGVWQALQEEVKDG